MCPSHPRAYSFCLEVRLCLHTGSHALGSWQKGPRAAAGRLIGFLEPLPGSTIGILLNTLLWDAGVVIVMNSPGQAARVLAEHQLQTSSSFLGPQVTGLLRIVCPSEVLILPSSPWRDSPCSRGWCADFSGLAHCNLTFSPLESFAVLLCSVSPCQGSGCKLPCRFRSLGLTCVQCVHVRVCVHTCI